MGAAVLPIADPDGICRKIRNREPSYFAASGYVAPTKKQSPPRHIKSVQEGFE